MSDRGKKAYIPWHEHVDEGLIKEIARQFVKDVFAKGYQIKAVKVTWEPDGSFHLSTLGTQLTRIKPPDGEKLH